MRSFKKAVLKHDGLKIGSRVLCKNCNFMAALVVRNIFYGDILKADMFQFNPEYPPFNNGEVFSCRKCGIPQTADSLLIEEPE